MKKIKNVAHLSDTHIQLLQRHDEYREVFSKLYKSLEEKETELIVITGDLFHSRVHLSPEAIDLSNELFDNLTKISDVIIIAGNHDAVIKSAQSRLDSISPVVEMFNKNRDENQYRVLYFKDTDVYKYKNIDFAVYSVLDYLNPDFKKFRDDSYKIALYHGLLQGSILDSGRSIENDERKIHYDKFDRILLGDIHKQQKIKDNAYYAGSLIQRNYGEHPINHGYLFHELSKPEPEFIRIPNTYGFYKLLYTGIKFEGEFKDIPDNANVRILYPKGVDRREVEKEFNEKYPNIKSYVIDLIVEEDRERNIDIKENINNLFSLENLNSLIEQYYGEEEKDTKDKMISLNKIIYEEVSDKIRESFVSGEFKLNSIEFDNMFSYGEGNIVDFKNLEGAIGLFSPNRMGKSSFLNTIKIAIYGNPAVSSLKINQEETINSDSDQYRTKINLSKEGDIYIIERTGKVTGSGISNKVNLFKNGVSISGTITEINNDIKTIFGDVDTFDKLFYISQRSPEMFLDLTPMQRKEWIYSNLGVDIFEILHRYSKDEYNKLMSKIEYLKDLDFEMSKQTKKLDIADLKKRIKDNKKNLKELRNNKSEIKKKIDSIKLVELPENFYNDLKETKRSIDNTTSFIEESNKKIYKKTEDIKSVKEGTGIHPDLIETENSIVTRQTQIEELEEKLNNELVSDRLTILNNKLDNIISEGKDAFENHKKKKSKIIEPDPLDFSDELYDKTILDLKDFEEKLSEVNFEIRSVKDKISKSESKSEILSADKRFENEELCKTCPLLSEAFESSKVLPKLNKELKKLNSEKEDLEGKIKECNYRIDHMDQQTKVWDLYIEEIKELDSLQIDIDDLLEKKVSFEEQIEHEKQSIKNNLEKDLKLYKERLEELKQLYKEKKESIISSSEEKIKALNETIKNKEEQLNSLKEKYNELNNLETEYEKNIDKKKKIEEHKKSIRKIEDDLELYENNLEVKNIELGKLKSQLEDIQEKEKEYNSYKEKIDLFKEYSKITHKDELPLLFVENILDLFQSEINEVINKISTFSIELEIENSNINSYVVENDSKWNTALCSGMERFVINIAFRLAISKIGNIVSPNFMIIDEGFNAMDANHSQSVPEVFNYLKKDFDHIFIVSHSIDYRDFVDFNLEINKVDGKSHIVNL